MSEHELWNELGNLYFMSSAYNQAIHAYRKSIQLESGFGRPYSNLALTYAQQGNFEEAIRLFRKGIELLDNDKEKAISWNRLGNVFRCIRDYREAVLAYQNADELDPESSENRDEPGQGLYTPSDPSIPQLESFPEDTNATLNEKTDAVNALYPDEDADTSNLESETASIIPAEMNQYEQVVSEMPEHASTENWMDVSFEEDIDSAALVDMDSESYVPELAESDLQDWSPAVPSQEPFAENIIEETREVMQPTISVSDLDTQTYYQETEPVNPGAFLAVENRDRTPTSRSEKIVSQVEVDVEELPLKTFAVSDHPECQSSAYPSVLDPHSSDTSTISTQDEEEVGKIEVEIEKLKRVIQINPHNGFAWDTLGNLYKSVNRFKEAILAYQQAISTNDAKAFYYHHLGLAYAAEGRNEDAVGALQKVIELDPNHSLAHATLGGYYRKMGLEELAQKHIGKAMKSIFDSENEYNRACLEAICGNAEQAISLLRIALEKKQTYVDWVLRDPDLDFIRQDPRFRQLSSDFAR